jgi:hypothetical protein
MVYPVIGSRQVAGHVARVMVRVALVTVAVEGMPHPAILNLSSDRMVVATPFCPTRRLVPAPPPRSPLDDVIWVSSSTAHVPLTVTAC